MYIKLNKQMKEVKIIIIINHYYNVKFENSIILIFFIYDFGFL